MQRPICERAIHNLQVGRIALRTKYERDVCKKQIQVGWPLHQVRGPRNLAPTPVQLRQTRIELCRQLSFRAELLPHQEQPLSSDRGRH